MQTYSIQIYKAVWGEMDVSKAPLMIKHAKNLLSFVKGAVKQELSMLQAHLKETNKEDKAGRVENFLFLQFGRYKGQRAP